MSASASHPHTARRYFLSFHTSCEPFANVFSGNVSTTRVVVEWRWEGTGEWEGTIDKGVPTKTGNEMWTYYNYTYDRTLSNFPDYLAGSHQYQLPFSAVSRIAINK